MDASKAVLMAVGKSLGLSTLVTPLLPAESTGLTMTGQVKSSTSFNASSKLLYPLAWGQLNPLSAKN